MNNLRTAMKQALFLDVDGMLIHTITNDNGTRKKIINQTVVDQLKLVCKDIYLFTNMDAVDIQNINDPARITRRQLVELLEAQGFKVHAVITPADCIYNKGSGAAYRDIYLKAYDKALGNEPYQEEVRLFKQNIDALNATLKANGGNKHLSPAGAQKKAMFHYFLKDKPADLISILYCDDDKNCLDAVNECVTDIKLTTCQISPDPKEPDPEPLRHAIDSFAPLAIKNFVERASVDYKKANEGLRFYMRFWHSNDGIIRAVDFAARINKLTDRKAIDKAVIEFLSNEKNGNTHPQSFRTHLLATLLHIPLTPQVSDNYKAILKSHIHELGITYSDKGDTFEYAAPQEKSWLSCGFGD